MLIKLLPDQIIKEWKVVRYAIEQSNPEQLFSTNEAIRDYLRNIIIGEMQVWAIVQDDEFVGLGVTAFSRDRMMGVKRLEIHSLYSFRAIATKTWVTCYVTLRRFAKANNCSHIMAITDQDNVIRLAQRMGGDTSQTMLVFKV